MSPVHQRDELNSVARRDKSAERLQALLASIDALVWEGDPNTGESIYISEGAERVLGYPASRWREDPQFWRKIIVGDDREWVLREMREAVKRRESSTLEFRVNAAEGRIAWVRNSVTLELDDEGMPCLARGVMMDITSFKENEQELAASKEKFRSIFDAVHDGLMLFRPDRTLEEVNASAERVMGMTREELHVNKARGPKLTMVNEAGERLSFAELPGTICFRTKQPVRDYVMGIEREGHPTRWVEANCEPMFDRDGNLEGVVTSLSDVTERKEGEAERDLLWRAVDHARSSIGIVGPEGTFEYVNAAFVRQSGKTREELIGSSAELFADEKAVSAGDSMRETLESGMDWTGKVHYERVDGTMGAFALSITPVRNAAGEISHYISVSEDVTERERLEEQLLQSQKLESVGRLAGGVAHDFNNLLTAIINYASFAADSMEEDDPALEDVKEVMAAGRRAAKLTSQLLLFARQQSAEAKLVDVNDVIMELDKMLRRLIGVDIELVILPAPEPAPAYIDPGQLEQVVVNLVVNARDAMPDGGQLTIAVARGSFPGKPGVQSVQLSVTDTGTGIAPEARKRLFEPFFTTKAQGKGTGLGLPTCYGIVAQAQGTIVVESEVGAGSTFTVTLPRADEVAVDGETTTPELALPPGRETLLVVDDEPLVRNLAKRVLEKAGYNVVAAESADEAMQVVGARGTRVDLLLTDIVMPKTSGRTLARMATRVLPELPVLYMSGYADDPELWEEVEAGRAEFIQKPFMAFELATKVRETLDGAGELPAATG